MEAELYKGFAIWRHAIALVEASGILESFRTDEEARQDGLDVGVVDARA